MPRALLALASTAALLAGCASEPEVVGGRCLLSEVSTALAQAEQETDRRLVVLGGSIRHEFRGYRSLHVPRGAVLVERAPGAQEFCTADRVKYYPTVFASNPMPGLARVCFSDRDEDGLFEDAAAIDDTDERVDTFFQELTTLRPGVSYARSDCTPDALARDAARRRTRGLIPS